MPRFFFCDRQTHGRVGLSSNRAASQKKSWDWEGTEERDLVCSPVVWLWERRANRGRLLQLFYIWDRMLLCSDGAEWEPAADVNVCRLNLRVCVSSRLFVGKTWPQFLASKPPCALSFFFSLPPFLIMFCLLPSKQPDSLLPLPPPRLFLLFCRPALTWLQHASLHPTAVFIIPAFAWIPLRESSLCLERQKKTVMSRTPPAGSPDGSQRFHMEQRDATHSKCRGCSVA